MRFVDEYRAPEQVMQLIEHLRERAALLPYTAERPLRIMEVCGGHTHAIFKFGLDQLLPENVEFIHGPGCPVCVLPMGTYRQLRGNRQSSGGDFLHLWRCHARAGETGFSVAG
ncbi:hydrogenase isoenzymes formation protein HypD [Salmonella enterica subsp. enterica serovar Hartford]|nr:hydrogenase isoenzymes formation protein HypD [Salmonella enterica subsp. enterica serovar Hartford]